jgi:nucleoside phosphorylase
MSVAVHILLHPELKVEIMKWKESPLKRLLLDSSFRSIFELAWRIEGIYQGKSSGCGPFASLVGSYDALPLIYSVLDGTEHRVYGQRMSELIQGDTDLLFNTLWNDAGIALVFSGNERRSTELTISNTEVIARKVNSGLSRLKRQLSIEGGTSDIPQELGQLTDLGLATKKVDSDLWDTFGLIFVGCMSNLLSGDIEDLKRMVNLSQGLLSFLTVSNESIDDFAHKCNLNGVSCKITGSGKGGDVLLFGRNDFVKRCVNTLVNAPLSLHFASWLNTESSHSVAGTTVEWVRTGERLPPLPRSLPQKADFALITAIEEEQKAVNVALETVKSAFGPSRDSAKRNGTDYFYGWIRSKANPQKEHFVVCGRCLVSGNQASQALTSTIVHDWDPAYILLVGTAGGVDGRHNIKPCDVVVSTTVNYDMKKQTPGQTQIYAQPLKAPSADLLRAVNHIIDSKEDWWSVLGNKPIETGRAEPKIVPEQIISGENLRGDEKAEELKTLLERLPRAVAVEMEGGGVAFALWEKGVRTRTEFTVVKGITDYVNLHTEDNQKTRDLCRDYAAKAAATLAISIISNIA